MIELKKKTNNSQTAGNSAGNSDPAGNSGSLRSNRVQGNVSWSSSVPAIIQAVRARSETYSQAYSESAGPAPVVPRGRADARGRPRAALGPRASAEWRTTGAHTPRATHRACGPRAAGGLPALPPRTDSAGIQVPASESRAGGPRPPAARPAAPPPPPPRRGEPSRGAAGRRGARACRRRRAAAERPGAGMAGRNRRLPRRAARGRPPRGRPPRGGTASGRGGAGAGP